MTMELFGLSVPRQFPGAGVTVYCQVPVGTPPSVHVVPETAPLQADPTVCTAFVTESYRFTM